MRLDVLLPDELELELRVADDLLLPELRVALLLLLLLLLPELLLPLLRVAVALLLLPLLLRVEVALLLLPLLLRVGAALLLFPLLLRVALVLLLLPLLLRVAVVLLLFPLLLRVAAALLLLSLLLRVALVLLLLAGRSSEVRVAVVLLLFVLRSVVRVAVVLLLFVLRSTLLRVAVALSLLSVLVRSALSELRVAVLLDRAVPDDAFPPPLRLSVSALSPYTSVRLFVLLPSVANRCLVGLLALLAFAELRLVAVKREGAFVPVLRLAITTRSPELRPATLPVRLPASKRLPVVLALSLARLRFTAGSLKAMPTRLASLRSSRFK